MNSFGRSREDRARSWECSYVMSTGDGVNLYGRLDVDMNRARFVAAAGMFGTACREAHGGASLSLSLVQLSNPSRLFLLLWSSPSSISCLSCPPTGHT
jgi:hypothetical protein